MPTGFWALAPVIKRSRSNTADTTRNRMTSATSRTSANTTARVTLGVNTLKDTRATSLAFNAFLAMFPLILGMLAIVGFAVNDPGVQAKLYNGIVSVFPADAHDEILKALTGVKHNAGILGIVSILGLLWSGTSLFASMEFALTKIFGTKQRDMLRQRLMGLIMVVVFIAAVLFAVVANSAAAASTGAGLIGAVAGAVVLVALMTAIYRFVPNRTFALKDIWPGAVLAGVVTELFSLLFPLYAKVSQGF